MLAHLYSVHEDDDVWMEYKYGNGFVNIPIEDLCPDCLSPQIEVAEVLGGYEAASVVHSETCIHHPYRRLRDATFRLYCEMPVRVAIGRDRVKDILRDFAGYRNEAMRTLITGKFVEVIRLKNGSRQFRRIR